ncbi:hypothetical protein H920_03241 [Fukomys damarensis]|uniref:Uncharacterized protein n=1 Tax=Fukomys damarensis TaxID=885580 RepID=A0A091DY24_FUKDA|nr:hypothetical protein H920_03241 [Fukomys damarensis]
MPDMYQVSPKQQPRVALSLLGPYKCHEGHLDHDDDHKLTQEVRVNQSSNTDLLVYRGDQEPQQLLQAEQKPSDAKWKIQELESVFQGIQYQDVIT